MKRLALLIVVIWQWLSGFAQGWPASYGGVMLQGFHWDSYSETSWAQLEAMADEVAPYFDLVWVPQSGWCNSTSNMMGYTPVYYFDQRSSFGTEAQLRSMIAAYRTRGTGLIADVVVNHRNNLGVDGAWTDFPVETYNGQTYQMLPSDICHDDDDGATRSWADKQGIQLSSADDTGDGWPGCRDLDHTSPNVQACIKAYLSFLLEDIGYKGFRYDMAKGFWASFIAEYNMAAKPAFSVGEYWSSTSDIRQWVDYTRGYVSDEPTSAAFDFQFRYRIRDAINGNDWRWLGYDDKPLSSEENYKRYAVTFVENHDTELRSPDNQQDPIRKDTLAANAYLLAMPGTPCVFWSHWRDNRLAIKQMILARRLAGITNTASSEEKYSAKSCYAKAVEGQNATLLCIVGSNPTAYTASSLAYREILSGTGYRYLLSRTANTVWMDMPDGTYEGPLTVTFTAVSKLSGAKIVYTTDGTEPTAESSQIGNGGTLSITTSCIVKAGILSGGKVYGVQSRQYKLFEPYDVTLHVHSDVTWAGITFYVWDSNNTQLNGNWPGKRVATSQQIGGKKWYCQTFRITSPEQYLNAVVSNTAGNKQTIDITNIRSDCYYLITGAKDDDKYIVEDVSEDIAARIPSIGNYATGQVDNSPFNLQGIPVSAGQKKGIVVERGRKVLYK